MLTRTYIRLCDGDHTDVVRENGFLPGGFYALVVPLDSVDLHVWAKINRWRTSGWVVVKKK